MSKIYIAYGSNMDLNQMAFRCPDAKLIGTGVVNGYRLLYKGSLTGAYATIERCVGRKVPVLVWEVSAADEARLDRYEGFPHFYYKRDLPIRMDDGAQLRGMAYIMHENRELGVPSAFYYNVLSRAYTKFHLDRHVLERSLSETLLGINKVDRFRF
jgi:hypothetical protein